MPDLIPFRFDAHEVRVLTHDDGSLWWVAKDICDVLDIADYRQAYERLDDDERGRYPIPTPGGIQDMICVNEPGLYSLILGSRKPEAKAFKRWITHEVIPTVRKTGTYSVLTSLPHLPALPPARTPEQDLALIRDIGQLLSNLGGLTDRDKLMLQDQARNVALTGQRLSSAGSALPTSRMWPIAERLVHLGYRLTRDQAAALIPKAGRLVAKEWRERYPGRDFSEEPRYVDGATRDVKAYHDSETEWIDAILQAYMAGFPGLQRVHAVQP